MVQRLAQDHTAEAQLRFKSVLLSRSIPLLIRQRCPSWLEAGGLTAWHVLYGVRRAARKPRGAVWHRRTECSSQGIRTGFLEQEPVHTDLKNEKVALQGACGSSRENSS